MVQEEGKGLVAVGPFEQIFMINVLIKKTAEDIKSKTPAIRKKTPVAAIIFMIFAELHVSIS